MTKRNTFVGPQLQRGRTGFNPDWKRLIAFVAVIVLGSIVATQILANSYRFHPALGFKVFHVYPPWSYFLWSHQWEQPSNHLLFARAFGIGSLVTLGGFYMITQPNDKDRLRPLVRIVVNMIVRLLADKKWSLKMVVQSPPINTNSWL
jgi:hypothetical protein